MDLLISLYLDDAKVGCGVREFVPLRYGTKWAELLYVPTLTMVRIPLDAAKRAKPVEVRPKALASRIYAIARQRKALGLPYNAKAAKEAALRVSGKKPTEVEAGAKALSPLAAIQAKGEERMEKVRTS